jgi:RNA polymerase sigma factor (TIGR02999 family)
LVVSPPQQGPSIRPAWARALSDNPLQPADSENRAAALARLVPLLYDEMRALARARLRSERPDHSLQATALVHEAYLRLLGADTEAAWNDRTHFMVAAAEAMRRILVDHARARGREKRGGGATHIELGEADAARALDDDDILALDEVLPRLEALDARTADVVRLRYFVGLTVEETAHALGVSERTVKREWAFARAWLFRALRG